MALLLLRPDCTSSRLAHGAGNAALAITCSPANMDCQPAGRPRVMTATAAQPGGRRAYTIAAVMLAVVFLTINSDLLLGRAMIAYDGDDFFAPYLSACWRTSRGAGGCCLYWNPWANGGMA